MLKRLICLGFLSLFATSVLVAYAEDDDTESGDEIQQPAELTALTQMFEAMNLEYKAPDNIDTETDKDSESATTTVSATATASESASATTSESASDSAASPATKPDAE